MPTKTTKREPVLVSKLTTVASASGYVGEARDGSLLAPEERRPWEQPYDPKTTQHVTYSSKHPKTRMTPADKPLRTQRADAEREARARDLAPHLLPPESGSED